MIFGPNITKKSFCEIELFRTEGAGDSPLAQMLENLATFSNALPKEKRDELLRDVEKHTDKNLREVKVFFEAMKAKDKLDEVWEKYNKFLPPKKKKRKMVIVDSDDE
jgi:uncharacterized Zn finger protein (UPF0148 family)